MNRDGIGIERFRRRRLQGGFHIGIGGPGSGIGVDHGDGLALLHQTDGGDIDAPHDPASIDMIVRATQDRALDGGGRLFAASETWPELGRTEMRAAPSRTGGPARIATVALRAGSVGICRPHRGTDGPRHLPLTVVEAREVDWNGEGTPLLWRLLTTIETIDAGGAVEIVRLYRLRWRIEKIFRSLKSDRLIPAVLDVDPSARQDQGALPPQTPAKGNALRTRYRLPAEGGPLGPPRQEAN